MSYDVQSGTQNCKQRTGFTRPHEQLSSALHDVTHRLTRDALSATALVPGRRRLRRCEVAAVAGPAASCPSCCAHGSCCIGGRVAGSGSGCSGSCGGGGCVGCGASHMEMAVARLTAASTPAAWRWVAASCPASHCSSIFCGGGHAQGHPSVSSDTSCKLSARLACDLRLAAGKRPLLVVLPLASMPPPPPPPAVLEQEVGIAGAGSCSIPSPSAKGAWVATTGRSWGASGRHVWLGFWAPVVRLGGIVVSYSIPVEYLEGCVRRAAYTHATARARAPSSAPVGAARAAAGEGRHGKRRQLTAGPLPVAGGRLAAAPAWHSAAAAVVRSGKVQPRFTVLSRQAFSEKQQTQRNLVTRRPLLKPESIRNGVVISSVTVLRCLRWRHVTQHGELPQTAPPDAAALSSSIKLRCDTVSALCQSHRRACSPRQTVRALGVLRFMALSHNDAERSALGILAWLGKPGDCNYDLSSSSFIRSCRLSRVPCPETIRAAPLRAGARERCPQQVSRQPDRERSAEAAASPVPASLHRRRTVTRLRRHRRPITQLRRRCRSTWLPAALPLHRTLQQEQRRQQQQRWQTWPRRRCSA